MACGIVSGSSPRGVRRALLGYAMIGVSLVASNLGGREVSQDQSERTRTNAVDGFTRGRALIIAIANYTHVTPLPPTVLNDGKAVYKLLTSRAHCGYLPENVKLMPEQEATADNIRTALKDLARDAGLEDTVVVYFSGHGRRVGPKSAQKAFLCPVNFDPSQADATGIGSAELTNLLADIKSERLVVLLDACRAEAAGAVKGAVPAGGEKPGLGNATYDALAEGRGRVIIAACRDDEVSVVKSDSRNSLFTEKVLDALNGAAGSPGDGTIRILEVFNYVALKVTESNIDQHPVLKTSMEKDFAVSLFQGGQKKTETRPGGSEIPIESVVVGIFGLPKGIPLELKSLSQSLQNNLPKGTIGTELEQAILGALEHKSWITVVQLTEKPSESATDKRAVAVWGHLRGVAFLNLVRREDALKSFERAHSADPASGDIASHIAECYQGLNLKDKEISALGEAIDRLKAELGARRDDDGLRLLASCYLRRARAIGAAQPERQLADLDEAIGIEEGLAARGSSKPSHLLADALEVKGLRLISTDRLVEGRVLCERAEQLWKALAKEGGNFASDYAENAALARLASNAAAAGQHATNAQNESAQKHYTEAFANRKSPRKPSSSSRRKPR